MQPRQRHGAFGTHVASSPRLPSAWGMATTRTFRFGARSSGNACGQSRQTARSSLYGRRWTTPSSSEPIAARGPSRRRGSSSQGSIGTPRSACSHLEVCSARPAHRAVPSVAADCVSVRGIALTSQMRCRGRAFSTPSCWAAYQSSSIPASHISGQTFGGSGMRTYRWFSTGSL